MPETIEDYYERVEAAADDEGRLATNAEIQAWEVFPFESEGLRLKPLEPLAQQRRSVMARAGNPVAPATMPTNPPRSTPRSGATITGASRSPSPAARR